MVQSTASTVEEYLAQLPPDRREAVSAIRQVILENLPEGYVECVQYGMIGYAIPLERYPTTYNGKPLPYAAIASQKNYLSVYLMCVYSDPDSERWFHDRYRAIGKKLDMGKSCLRFKMLDDVPLELLGETIAHFSVDEFIAVYEAARRR